MAELRRLMDVTGEEAQPFTLSGIITLMDALGMLVRPYTASLYFTK